MYAHFFGLKQAPFSIAPDPRYLFMSQRHREALAHLLYGLGAGGGFVLLTGEIGAGKTTVCNCFLEQIPDSCNLAYIFNPKLTVTELLQSVCEEFGLPRASLQSSPLTVKDCLDPLNDFLLRSHAAGQNNVLIIDEAQNLAEDVLEQLRLLTNLETSERKLLQIILIGQPGLRKMLTRPELEQLAQRVIARFHLDAMTEAETALYIDHRLTVAGRTHGNPFERKALQRIHHHTGGVPRRINLLCDRALLGAYSTGSATVDARTVDKAATEVFDMAAAAAPKPTPTPRKWQTTALPVALLGLAVGAVATGWIDHQPQTQTRTQPNNTPAPQPTAITPQLLPTLRLSMSTSTNNSTSAGVGMAPSSHDAPVHFARPTRDVTLAWRTLAPRWKLNIDTAVDPCSTAQHKQIHCFRIKSISLPLIQQLNRPGILTLLDGDQKPMYAVLTSMNGEQASLQMGEDILRMPISTLTQMWQGDFATYWHTPPGYTKAISAGHAGPEVDWLAEKLAKINGAPPPVQDNNSTRRLPPKSKAFN